MTDGTKGKHLAVLPEILHSPCSLLHSESKSDLATILFEGGVTSLLVDEGITGNQPMASCRGGNLDMLTCVALRPVQAGDVKLTP
jgi:hypothetical protein